MQSCTVSFHVITNKVLGESEDDCVIWMLN